MKKARKWVAALTVCAMAFTLTACGGGNDAKQDQNADANANAEPVVMRLATTVNEQDSFQVAAEKFAELVSEGTDGAYTIEIHPNGELGDEADMLASMAAFTRTRRAESTKIRAAGMRGRGPRRNSRAKRGAMSAA